ncbi:MAG TPA: amidohydrolase family protein [Terriglobia bacterium]|nr:amidohydrolase family protein [Terriglobia bacterium]
MTAKHFVFALLASFVLLPVSGFAQMYAIRNVRIVTVSGATIPNGHILIQDGKIAAIGPSITIPSSAKVIDAKGLTAYPGMIDAHTVIGLTEIDSISATQDTNELGDLNPHMKASAAINPLSEHVAITRVNGVTTVASAPVGGLFAGQAAIINLDGWVMKDILLKDSAATIINFPRDIRLPANATERQRRDAEDARRKRLELLRKTLRDAQSYARLVDAKVDGDSDLALRSLVPVVKGEMPAIFTVDTAAEIRGALDIAEEFKLKAILSGCSEAWRVVDLLKSKSVPVLFSGLLDLPTSDLDAYDSHYSTPAALSKAGVKFAFTAGGASSVRDLPFQAGMAVGFGLDKDEALKAVTLYPAQILNIADKVGSIQEGKVANIIITDGDPLELLSHVKHLFIAGKPVEVKNKHTDLYDTFSKRP